MGDFPTAFERDAGGTRGAFSLDMMSTRTRPASIPTRAEGTHPRRRAAREGPEARERAFVHGLDHLDDASLIALLIEDAEELPEHRAARILEEAGGLGGLASRGVGALSSDLRLDVERATRLAAACEIGVRLAALARDTTLDPATCAGDVERWAATRLAFLPHEELWVLLLDSRNRIVAERMIARGGVHALATTAGDVLRPVVRESSTAFVLVHNHPGGDPCPSREDLAFTRAVSDAAATLAITMVDHVVIARDSAISMLESGLLDTLEG